MATLYDPVPSLRAVTAGTNRPEKSRPPNSIVAPGMPALVVKSSTRPDNGTLTPLRATAYWDVGVGAAGDGEPHPADVNTAASRHAIRSRDTSAHMRPSPLVCADSDRGCNRAS